MKKYYPILYILLCFTYSYAQDAIQDTNAVQHTATPAHSLRSWNYFPVRDTGGSTQNQLREPLVWNVTASEQKQVVLFNAENEKSLSTVYAIGSGTIIFGGLTAYAKLHSDNLYKQYINEYNTTGAVNTNLHNDVRKFDTLSAVSLAITEIGFLYLSYSLLNL